MFPNAVTRVTFAQFVTCLIDDMQMAQTYSIDTILRHPLYRGRGVFHDVAIVFTNEEIQFNQQTKPIFNAPFKPKQWPRRGSRQFGDIFLHTKVGMSAIYSLTTKPQATDFFRQFVYLLTEQKPGTKTFWFYKGILLIFFWRT